MRSVVSTSDTTDFTGYQPYYGSDHGIPNPPCLRHVVFGGIRVRHSIDGERDERRCIYRRGGKSDDVYACVVSRLHQFTS